MAFDFGSFAGGMGRGMQSGAQFGGSLKRMMAGQGQQPAPIPEAELNPLPLEGGGGYEGFQAQLPGSGGSKFGGLQDLMMRLLGR
jgi:hypothetical protein